MDQNSPESGPTSMVFWVPNLGALFITARPPLRELPHGHSRLRRKPRHVPELNVMHGQVPALLPS